MEKLYENDVLGKEIERERCKREGRQIVCEMRRDG